VHAFFSRIFRPAHKSLDLIRRSASSFW